MIREFSYTYLLDDCLQFFVHFFHSVCVSYVIISDKNGLGYILGDFFTNASCNSGSNRDIIFCSQGEARDCGERRLERGARATGGRRPPQRRRRRCDVPGMPLTKPQGGQCYIFSFAEKVAKNHSTATFIEKMKHNIGV
jgi:hypothetical protein